MNGLVASRLFATHFGHVSIVATWFSALCFAGSRFSNYLSWLADPLTVKPSAQILYAGYNQVYDVVNMDLGASTAGLQVTSGIFQVWRAWGIVSGEQLFALALGALLFGLLMLVAGWYHHHRAVPNAAWFNDVDAILTHHLTAVVGLGSLSWAGHLVHVAIPVDAFLRLGMDPEGLDSDALALLGAVPFGDVAGRLLVLDWASAGGLVSWLGGWNPSTGSLWLSDVVHHHLAVGILAILAGHMYRTQYSLGTSMSLLLRAHRATAANSWHAQLAINLGVLGTGSILFGHLLLAVPAYPFLWIDWSAELSLFTHHAWIGGFCIVGSASHAAIFLVSDYRPGTLPGLERLLAQRHTITAHLNWVSIFLGFHAFGMYIHNDTLSALGRRADLFGDDAIPFRPVLGLLGQSLLGTDGASSLAGSFTGTRLTGTADLLVHHIHAFTIHVTALILLKGVLFARSSRLVSDKSALGFRFP